MNDQAKQYQQIIAKCWADEAFKQQLIADPVQTLRHESIEIADGVKVNVLENNDRLLNIVPPQATGDLSEDELAQVTG